MAEVMSLDERRAALDAIAEPILVCTKCALHTGRTHAVPGAGRADADIMFIGEGPGYHEDQQGLPFVGASGKYLDDLLSKIGMTRADVFITNVVKCRPPGNRDPLPDEINTCVPAYLKQQIEIIQPKLIATLGRFSMALFFPPNSRITQIHGQPKHQEGRIYYPLFHPAAVLRNMNLQPAMEADFKRMLDLIKEIQQTEKPTSKPDDEPPTFKQLSLF
ncbi:MAG TPA: uracil-DNA glycosylase [Aggregatilineaceae bacterium]|nr:uracil-DNA glycosylase [Aggregatilineaceae bacterium]